jgi:hypothetical protein
MFIISNDLICIRTLLFISDNTDATKFNVFQICQNFISGSYALPLQKLLQPTVGRTAIGFTERRENCAIYHEFITNERIQMLYDIACHANVLPF